MTFADPLRRRGAAPLAAAVVALPLVATPPAEAAEEGEEPPLWRGEVVIGAVARTGTRNAVQFDGDLTTRRLAGPWRTDIELSGSYGRAAGTMTARRFYGRLKTSYDFAENRYVFGIVDYENDRFRGYRHIFSESVGLGWRLVETETFRLDGEAGPTFRQARRRADGRMESEVLLRLAVDMTWYISPTATFTNETALLLAQDRIEVAARAAGTGVRRDALETRNLSALTMPIIGELSTRISVELRYTSSPPPEATPLETRSRVGVVYGF